MSGIKNIMFLAIVVVFGTISCNQSHTYHEHPDKQNEDLITQRFYYKNGKLKAERTCKIIEGDTVLHGYGKLFYPNGQLQVELSYKDGKKQGGEKGYYENGMLEYSGWYLKDKKDSLWFWYYNITNAKSEPFRIIELWKDGIQISHQTLFFQNGEIETYLFCDPLGRPIYKCEYSDDGSLLMEEGMKSPQIVIVTTNQDISKFIKGDILKARIYYIMPPNTETNVFVRIEGLHDEWKEKKSTNYYTPIIFENTLDKIGNYKLEVKLKLRDKQKTETVEFINQFEFTVR